MANATWVGGDAGGTGDYSIAANWSPSGVPGVADNVRIPANASYDINAGLNQSAVAIGDFIVEEGYSGTIGSSAAYLQIDPDRFEFHGSGESWVDIGTANISVQIFDTGTAAVGKRALYLKGSNIVTLSVDAGSVGVAVNHGEAATIATVRVVGASADVWLGEGVTLTTVQNYTGKAAIRCGATTVTVYGGTVTTEEEGVITTVNVKGGTLYSNSTGTVTTMTLSGGMADFTTNGVARTVTTLKQNPGSQLKYDPSVLTITTRSAPDDPILLTAVAA